MTRELAKHIRFNFRYFLWALSLFIIEVLIALLVDDKFVRPYLGDFLVVILIYTCVLAFFRWHKMKVAAGVLIFAYLIEILQYFDFLTRVNLRRYELARVVLGTGFSVWDLVAYTLGILFVIWMERRKLFGS